MLDPPWAERGGSRIKRAADRHYDLLDTARIPTTIMGSGLFRPDERNGCHLYLWVTNNFLEDGLWLTKRLGFRYITNLVWVKEGGFGLGQYFRGQHELCLFAVKGPTLFTQNRSTSTVVTAPKRGHSQKPETVYDLIERCSYPPHLEMFARATREGWTSWGNEVPISNPAAIAKTLDSLIPFET